MVAVRPKKHLIPLHDTIRDYHQKTKIQALLNFWMKLCSKIMISR